MQYIIIILTALLSSIGASIGTYIASKPKALKGRVEANKEWQKNMDKAMRSLLRNEIQQKYTEMSYRGYALPYEKQNIGYLFESYSKLGGNSYVKSLYESMMALKTVDNNTKDKEDD